MAFAFPSHNFNGQYKSLGNVGDEGIVIRTIGKYESMLTSVRGNNVSINPEKLSLYIIVRNEGE